MHLITRKYFFRLYFVKIVQKYNYCSKQAYHEFWICAEIHTSCSCHAFIILLLFVIFVPIMNFVDVILQIPCLRIWFSTKFTFAANSRIVSLQRSCFRKWFTTSFAFVIFVAFMNCVDVLLQRSYLWKWFATRFTFWLLNFYFMNCVDVFL